MKTKVRTNLMMWNKGVTALFILLMFTQLSAAEKAADSPKEQAVIAQNLTIAEGFIDAFYSFNSTLLDPYLSKANETSDNIRRYQGWAEGGNYKVLQRQACQLESPSVIVCSITVQDDPVQALHTGFNVTDTFHLTFDNGHIMSIDTSSDDQPIYYEAKKWVEANMPEVMTGPCDKSAKTPGDCARAMTEGYKRFYGSVNK
ncbi:MAG: hypothetical protein ACI808_001907 [Paraglaciecola sp.]|jgi:hypothetical protein